MKSLRIIVEGVPGSGKSTAIGSYLHQKSKVFRKLNFQRLKSEGSLFEFEFEFIKKKLQIRKIKLFYFIGETPNLEYRARALKKCFQDGVLFFIDPLPHRLRENKDYFINLVKNILKPENPNFKTVPMVFCINKIDILESWVEDEGPVDELSKMTKKIITRLENDLKNSQSFKKEIENLNLPDHSIEYLLALDKLLNPYRFPCFLTVAYSGYNIDRALLKLIEMIETRQDKN